MFYFFVKKFYPCYVFLQTNEKKGSLLSVPVQLCYIEKAL